MSVLRTLCLGAALLGGCGGSLFSTRLPVESEHLGNALARAKRAAAAVTNDAVVLGVSAEPNAVFAYDLRARRLLFRVPCKAVAVPALAGPLVVVPEADKVVLRRLRDGSVVREIDNDGMQLVGADGDGIAAAITLSNGGALHTRSRLILLEGEKVRFDQRLDRLLGRPAVLGGLAFVPHHRVHLSVVDPRGEELARVRIRRDVASYAFTQRDDVYFGQRGVYLVDTELARLDGQEAHYLPLEVSEKLPGNPPPLPDTSQPRPPVESALHRVSLDFTPERSSSGIALTDQTLYFGFYRLLFALSPDASEARWVHRTQGDVAGVHATPGGVIVVEQSGEITALDASGRTTYTAQLGLTAVGVRIEAPQLGSGTGGEAPSAATSLAAAANDPDARLVPAQALAAKLLGKIEDDEAAEALIGLCAREESVRQVGSAACDALASRPWPSNAVLAALGRQASFLEETPPPPLAALARAVRTSGDRRAAEPLGAQLEDPATPVEALGPIMSALGELGDPKSAVVIARFLKLYHADPGEVGSDEALATGMEALAKLDVEHARRTLEPLGNAPLAQVGVRGAATRVLASIAKPAEPAAADADESAEAGNAETGAAAQAPEEPPAQLTGEHVDSALSSVRPELARCVREAPEKPASARFTLVISGGGDLVDIKALPPSVQPCAAPLLQSARFPATKYGKRAVMSYVVAR